MGIVKEGEQGLLFPRKNAQALSETLGALIANPEYARQLGDTGRRMVEQYRWQAVARQVEDYYLDCITENSGHTG